MTTVSQLIKDGFREGNTIPRDRDVTDAENAEALRLFNRMMQSLLGFEGGQYLRNWPVPPNRSAPVAANYPLPPENRDLSDNEWPYPPANSQIYAAITSPTTIYFDGYPHDGARMSVTNVGMTDDLTLDGNGKLIEGSATKIMSPSDTFPRSWFYRGDLGEWKYVPVDFTTADESVLHPQFDDLLTTGLAIRLSSRYGKDPKQGTVATFQRTMQIFKAQTWQPTPVRTGSPLGRRREGYGSDIVTGRTS